MWGVVWKRGVACKKMGVACKRGLSRQVYSSRHLRTLGAVFDFAAVLIWISHILLGLIHVSAVWNGFRVKEVTCRTTDFPFNWMEWGIKSDFDVEFLGRIKSHKIPCQYPLWEHTLNQWFCSSASHSACGNNWSHTGSCHFPSKHTITTQRFMQPWWLSHNLITQPHSHQSPPSTGHPIKTPYLTATTGCTRVEFPTAMLPNHTKTTANVQKPNISTNVHISHYCNLWGGLHTVFTGFLPSSCDSSYLHSLKVHWLSRRYHTW